MAKSRAFARKSLSDLARDTDGHGLKRSLGPVQLILLGVGCIVGAGIYVMTGTAAANFAGPAVLISFVIAAVACGLVALCYAELASALPVSGSAYTYCYAAMGEVFAWGIGWLLLLEYSVAASALAVGFSGYFASILADLGLHLPTALSISTVQSSVVNGETSLSFSGGINLVAVLAIIISTAALVPGVSRSSGVNAVLVAIKIAVLGAFVVAGLTAIDPDNWKPFIPANEGGFAYGWPGIFRAASILFWAYIGFETVSNAAAESRNPSRDMPIGILGALAACTLIYIIVAAVLVGVAPYRSLGVPDPIAVAVDLMRMPMLALLVKFGALIGLASVLLVNGYGQSRLAFAISRDGLLPGVFSALHPRFKTPWLGTIILGSIAASVAALLPISVLIDLISMGTALAFSIVALSVMWLRSVRPDLPRPFRVPFGGFWVGKVWIGYVPVLAILMCWTLFVPVGLDIARQALRGDILPASLLAAFAIVGTLVYAFYGLRRERAPMESAKLTPTPD